VCHEVATFLGTLSSTVEKLDMQEYRPVTRLRDVGAAVRVQPLESGDNRYVDLGRGREIQRDREFFSQLLFNGSVLEYDGGESWYDVHPIIQGLRAFRDTLDRGSSAAQQE
jgi:hypothetical protein